MLDALKGWKTYLVFGATLILAVAAKLGWAPADETTVGAWVTFLTDPVFLGLIGLVLRKVSTGPAAL
jgi:hypothetical protein